MELAVLGEDRLFVSWEYHIVHCTYMYMAMHRAYTVRGYIDSHLDDWNHTRHCQKILLERNMEDVDISTVGFLRFPECRAVWDVGFAGSPQNEKMPWTRYD
ncbi:hypothetical protein BGW36DRAFT_388628 [Talaromyces proteolyticus]|uniref:Uncharacterized protein n=1 Tax=Talaromyces proteolyticus TaxID=1131652 RepID=A0AAD4KKZ5_9EURO|nr:uncharacterized protein BGW36DRAFT_388628 [Talaromyces proteolyticus]KAH8691591.1 hypothetical protein BGW36DRAFT_388628 [Talaromyces proteolyticus]